MRSKNTQQLQVMIDRAKETAATVYREVRGDHIFTVSRQQMPTRSCPCEYTLITVRRIGMVLHRRVEHIRDGRCSHWPDQVPLLAAPEKPVERV